jgi:hypothetical protein
VPCKREWSLAEGTFHLLLFPLPRHQSPPHALSAVATSPKRRHGLRRAATHHWAGSSAPIDHPCCSHISPRWPGCAAEVGRRGPISRGFCSSCCSRCRRNEAQAPMQPRRRRRQTCGRSPRRRVVVAVTSSGHRRKSEDEGERILTGDYRGGVNSRYTNFLSFSILRLDTK